MTNPIETLLDLASKIEDFPEDVSGTDAVSTIRAATEALEARMAEAVFLLKGWSAYNVGSNELMADTRAFVRAADSADTVRHPQETMRGSTGFAASGQQTARSASPCRHSAAKEKAVNGGLDSIVCECGVTLTSLTTDATNNGRCYDSQEDFP